MAKIQFIEHSDYAEYIFLEMSKAAIDEWFVLLMEHFEEQARLEVPMLRVLIDIETIDKFPEIAHAFQKIRKTKARLADLPPRRYAIVGYTSGLEGVLKPFFEMIRLLGIEYAYFTSPDRAKAIEWLMR